MAGHNKWSKIKRQKAKEDKKKSKVWARLSREIATAAREGGGDPDMNATLANAIERAEAENMAKDTIERAIKRGTGELEGQNYEPATYEGYGPHGIAVFVEAMTDNNNRTVADLRHLFSTHGGNLGKDGSVGYLFEQKGEIVLPADATDELTLFELAVEAGAEDVQTDDDAFVITTSVDAFTDVEGALEDAGLEPESAELTRIPTTTLQLSDDDKASVMKLVEAIEDLDDVDAVYTTLAHDGDALALTADEE
ncbi:YebC/PmpR family DNA-binding transcriptional regulator [Salisaeta longa]|uniref:YebC/PmpR family DNA-binding transcriptional regulator n=1 Tax=Salisaeta longa TaxID=503170 RepID=UPI0003B3DFB6|nr:YebC/PmpR family DNA-binding transcriptional regulator [Salisaeta longa]